MRATRQYTRISLLLAELTNAMGNTSSTVTAGIKDQVNRQSNAMNQLADITGNGELADAAREAIKTGSFEVLDALIEEKVKPMLYNDGEGEMMLINEIIAQRHKERTGNPFTPPHSNERKFVCWRLDSRGAVGETMLHTCFLSGLPKHMKLLAERLLVRFPKIINDFYINDEYYGETALHMGIVSEDPEIVRFLLKNGSDVNTRCSGNFFTCDDQKGSRSDHADIEHAVISKHTNYPGHLYWGEYPLSFAACLSQMECFRMLVARGADLNALDSNGNTVLHICTIHENWMMFKMALSLGADLHILNRQNLTPFTLAAFLAKKEMFEKIIEEERLVNWNYGEVQEAVYPLEHLDSIEPTTGKINRDSALAIVVYGEKSSHLQLLPNLLEQLVLRKWNTYGKNTFVPPVFVKEVLRLYNQLAVFFVYFFCVMACFLNRPSLLERSQGERFLACPTSWDGRAMQSKDLLYHILNLLCVLGAALYLTQTYLHVRNVGRKMYILGLSGFPAKAIFLMSCVLMLFSFVMRLACLDEAEDIFWVMAVLLTAVKFLYFCRGFRSVGPFVLMLYKIILRDLMRFFLIYLVIVIGFSQAFYVIFLGYKRGDPNYQTERREKSIMSNVAESYVRMFMMSLTEFAVFFEQLEDCEHTVIGKITFVIYMLLVTLLLINMLIAMMTNTYTEVSGNSLEWLRQWSAIIMMMEQCYDPKTRLRYQANYSILMEDGKSKALLLKSRLKQDELSEKRDLLHAARRRFRDELRRRPQGVQLHTIAAAGANYFSKRAPRQD